MSERDPVHNTTQPVEPEVYDAAEDSPEQADQSAASETDKPVETGGPTGPEPTRYGDWERKGRCIDF